MIETPDSPVRAWLPFGWLAVVAAFVCVPPARAAVLINRDPAIARYDGGAVNDGNTTGGTSGIPAASSSSGFAFNLEFTPAAADLTGTVLLMEIGGTASGTGLFLVEGVPTFVSKQGSADDRIPEYTLPDLNLFDQSGGPNSSGVVAAQSGFGSVSAGQSCSIGLTWDHVGKRFQFDVQSGSQLTTNSFTVTGTPVNWAGNSSLTVGPFTVTNSIGSGAGANVGSNVGAPWDADLTKSLAGSIQRALYWNGVPANTVWNFNSDGNLESWSGWNQINNPTVSGGVLHLDITGSDPFFSRTGLNLNGSKNPYVYLNQRNQTAANRGQIFWITSADPNWEETKMIRFTFTTNSAAFQTYEINLSGNTNWIGQTITGLRVDPIDSVGVSSGLMDIDFIAVSYRLAAQSPSPADGTFGVATNVSLSWSPAPAAPAHDIFFGNNYDAVNVAETNSASYRGRQSPTTFNPGVLQPGTLYYWRIDEVGSVTAKGQTWRFATDGERSTPADGTFGVATNVSLSWSPAPAATAYDIYFWTNYDAVNLADTNSAIYRGRQSATTFNPGVLQPLTFYYWRIDEVGSVTVKGQTWRFATDGEGVLLERGQLLWPSPVTLLSRIVQHVQANPGIKPLTRTVLHPANTNSPLHFDGQSSLTKALLNAYLDRAVTHMNGHWNDWNSRGMQFLEYSGAKFLHWGDLGWARLYTAADWQAITAAADTIHGSSWGGDIILECGIMEAIYPSQADNQRIPDWYLQVLQDLGIQQQRTFGPNGPQYFRYESMFDRTAPDWPWVDIWGSGSDAPDITMFETLLWYAWLASEYIDAGFEGIMWGQTMMTGTRDYDHAASSGLCEFARQWANARGYRKAMTLTSHVNRAWNYPTNSSNPVFTHLTWPTRMSYTTNIGFGMQFGVGVPASPPQQGGQEIEAILQLPSDLPILLEIDNYGPGSPWVCDQGWDEITAFAQKPAADRRAFLDHYYYAMRNWTNSAGNNRIHFALPSLRPLNVGTSLGVDTNNVPFPALGLYEPYREVGGDEEKIRELFLSARLPAYFPPHPVTVRRSLGQVELEWHPQNGKASCVEAAGTLSGVWSTVAGPIAGVNSTAIWQEPVSSTNRFYRIRIE